MKQNVKYLINDFKNDFKRNLKELKSKKTFYKQIPNILTCVRLLAPIPFNILYFMGNIKWATIILALAFFTDCIDGKIARKYNIVSKFGANLDAICDKFMVIGVIIPICASNYFFTINLLLEIIIAFINTYSSILGIKVTSSKIGKFKTWPLFITIIMAYLNMFIKFDQTIIITLIILTTLLQILTSLDYLSKNAKEYFANLKKETAKK